MSYKYSDNTQIIVDIVAVFEYLREISHELDTTLSKLFEIDTTIQKSFVNEYIKNLSPSAFDAGEIFQDTAEAILTIEYYDITYLGIDDDYINRITTNMKLSIRKIVYPDNTFHYELIYAGYQDRYNFMSTGAVLYEEQDGNLKVLFDKAFELNSKNILSLQEEDE